MENGNKVKYMKILVSIYFNEVYTRALGQRKNTQNTTKAKQHSDDMTEKY